jgi:hypothetical protein
MDDVSKSVTESSSDMIELKFSTSDGPIVVEFNTPVATPEANRPWAIEVRLNGRPSTIVGEDPLEALELAARFAASYLSGREGLDPAVNDLPLKEANDLLAQGFREGILALLEVRGIPCPDAASAHIAACTEPATLQLFLARAKTAASIDEILAALSPPTPPGP